jgi:ribose 5-phosphate isomerase B
MKIAIGTDHNGTIIKNELVDILSKNYEIIDCSKNNYQSDDYPDYAFEVGKLVSSKKANFGILICGTGIGMSIAANKVKGIRCALIHNVNEAKLAKIHNDANIIALGAYNSVTDMVDMINTFINTPPIREDRHQNRIDKIIKYELGE